ncbi:MAG: DedA family protein [Myxococcota bacterium]|jgi:membrane protein DedA with SNARE-associated domain
MESFIIAFIQKYLLMGVFALLLMCGLGIPMPEDVILLTGGYFSYLYPAHISLPLLVLVSMTGVLVGDTMIFFIGRKLGPSVVTAPMFKRFMTPQRLETMSGYFRSYGNKIVFMGRFMAGIRAPLFLSAGVLGHPYRKFILYDGLAALISVPALVLLAHYFGEELDRLKFMLVKAHKVLFIMVPIIITVYLLFRKYARKRELEIPEDPDDRPDST